MKFSIKNKLILAFSTLIFLVLTAQLVFNFCLAKDFYINHTKNTMKKISKELCTIYDNDNLDAISEKLEYYEDSYNLNILIKSNGKLVYTSFDKHINQYYKSKPPYRNNIQPNIKQEKPIDKLDKQDTPNLLQYVENFDYKGSTINIVLSVPIRSLEQSSNVFSAASTNIALIAMIIGSIVAIALAKNITKPIKEIEHIANQYSNLEFIKKANEDSSYLELSSLAKSINSMSRKLEENISNLNDLNKTLKHDIDMQKELENLQREFIASVSHEMKTPLAVMQMYAENLKINIDGVDKDYYCNVISEESQKLSNTVSSMLKISTMDQAISNKEFKEFNINETLNNLLEKMKYILEPFNIEKDIDLNLKAYGSEMYLEQAMRNYIVNATEHTKENKKIVISLHVKEREKEKHNNNNNNNNIYFSVFNEGEHIKDNDINHLWDSFYSCDKSRTSKNNAGLGLSIVKSIITRHKGSYNVSNVKDGVEFSWKIPTKLI